MIWQFVAKNERKRQYEMLTEEWKPIEALKMRKENVLFSQKSLIVVFV